MKGQGEIGETMEKGKFGNAKNCEEGRACNKTMKNGFGASLVGVCK